MTTIQAKRFWQSNVFQVIALFEFLPALILYMTGELATDAGKALMSIFTTGVSLYLVRDIGTKGAEAYRDRGN